MCDISFDFISSQTSSDKDCFLSFLFKCMWNRKTQKTVSEEVQDEIKSNKISKFELSVWFIHLSTYFNHIVRFTTNISFRHTNIYIYIYIYIHTQHTYWVTNWQRLCLHYFNLDIYALSLILRTLYPWLD